MKATPINRAPLTANACSMPQAEITRIKEILEYRRQARSATEESFIARYIDTIPGICQDDYGNRILVCKESKVMISCHTDSVSRTDGKQRVAVSPGGIVSLHKRERISDCLGADDAAGIYAALRMIEAEVKATFIFHRDEESGGKGSTWLARQYKDWVSTFDVCLALDRRGTKDVIVSQSWGKCASSEFAAGLAMELGMGHSKADGIFTDSANYVDLIPECSNLSIGYYNEHSTAEILDLNYLETVIRALIGVDWSKVPVARVPGDDGMKWHGGSDDDEMVEYCAECYCELTVGNCTVLDAPDICDKCWDKLTCDAPIDGTLDERDNAADGLDERDQLYWERKYRTCKGVM